jgi:dienelactone hydrolase
MPAGYLVRPRPRAGAGLFEGPERYASVLLVHEKRGVDAYVENAARRVVLESFMVFAPEARSIDELHAAALWLKKHPRSTSRVAVLGLSGGATAKALAERLGKDLNAVASFDGDPPVEPDEAWQRTMLQFITSLT